MTKPAKCRLLSILSEVSATKVSVHIVKNVISLMFSHIKSQIYDFPQFETNLISSLRPSPFLDNPRNGYNYQIIILSYRVDPSASNMPKHEPLSLGAVPNSVVLWQAGPKAPDAERYYNFRYIRGKTIGGTSLFLFIKE